MNFLKPGKGVSKEKRNLNGFMQYFSSLYHNYTKLFVLNLINLIFLIPYALFMESVKAELNISAGIGYFYNILSMIIYTLIGISPVSMGVSTVCTLFAKDEPSFFISDLKDGIKKNRKEGITLLIINTAVFYLLMVGYKFYFFSANGYGMMKIIYVIMIFLYLIIYIYINYLAVNYKLSIPALYKKSLIFAIINLPQNILLLSGIALIYALCFFISTLLGYFISGTIAYSLACLLVTLYAQRTVKKYEKK